MLSSIVFAELTINNNSNNLPYVKMGLTSNSLLSSTNYWTGYNHFTNVSVDNLYVVNLTSYNITGNINVSGYVNATTFYGDGSNLDGVVTVEEDPESYHYGNCTGIDTDCSFIADGDAVSLLVNDVGYITNANVSNNTHNHYLSNITINQDYNSSNYSIGLGNEADYKILMYYLGQSIGLPTNDGFRFWWNGNYEVPFDNWGIFSITDGNDHAADGGFAFQSESYDGTNITRMKIYMDADKVDINASNTNFESSGNTNVSIHGGYFNKNASLWFYDGNLDMWEIMMNGLDNGLHFIDGTFHRDMMSFEQARNWIYMNSNLTIHDYNENFDAVVLNQDTNTIDIYYNITSNGNFTTTGNITANYFCNINGCYNLSNISNNSNYYLITNPNGFFNSTSNFTIPIINSSYYLATNPNLFWNNTDNLSGKNLNLANVNITNLNITQNITYSDTYWDDINVGGAILGKGTAAPTMTSLNATGIEVPCFVGAAQDDYVSGCIEMPHSWKIGSDAELHIHTVHDSTSTNPMIWRAIVKIMNMTGQRRRDYIVYNLSTPNGQWMPNYIDFIDLNMTGFELGMQVCFQLMRQQSNASDTNTGGDCLITAGIHYQLDSPGSREEYNK
jgi:hypothetical protein